MRVWTSDVDINNKFITASTFLFHNLKINYDNFVFKMKRIFLKKIRLFLEKKTSMNYCLSFKIKKTIN